MLARISYALIVLAFIAPVAAAAWLVRSFGVEVMWLDGWERVNLLGGGSLAEPYNEHIYLLPRLVTIASGYSSMTQMYVIVAALAVCALLVMLMFKNPLWAIPVPFLLLSFRHYENLLWANQTSFALAACLSAGALLAAFSRAWPASVVLALGATLSAAQGLFVWPAAAIALLVSREYRRALVLGICGVAVWALYIPYVQTATDTGYALSNPVETVTYFFALAGGVFSEEPFVLGGVVICTLALVAVWVGRGPLLGLILFSGLCMTSISAGRVELGVFEGCCPATASRYAIFAALFVAGVYGVFASRYTEKLYGALAALAGVTIVLGLAVAYTEGYESAREEGENRAGYALTVTLGVDSPELSAPYASANDPPAVLEDRELNVYE